MRKPWLDYAISVGIAVPIVLAMTLAGVGFWWCALAGMVGVFLAGAFLHAHIMVPTRYLPLCLLNDFAKGCLPCLIMLLLLAVLCVGFWITAKWLWQHIFG